MAEKNTAESSVNDSGNHSKLGASGWTYNDLKDISSVGFLQKTFAQDIEGRFFPQFNCMDKYPNFDGNLFIGKKEKDDFKISPIAEFEVQIKTLPQNYHNANTRGRKSDFKYECVCAPFCAVLDKVTKNPVLLLLVDAANNKAFSIHLSAEYCFEAIGDGAQKTCTVYFDDIDEINDLDMFFDHLIEISETKDSEDTVLTRGIDQEMKTRLTEACFELNRTMDNDLRFIKNRLFRRVKQFGFACCKNGPFIVVKVFKVEQDEDGELIRTFEFEPTKDGEKKSFLSLFEKNDLCVYFRNAANFDPKGIIRDFCKTQIEKYCKGFNLPVEYMPDEVLREIAFYFLDYVAAAFPTWRDSSPQSAWYGHDSIALADLKKIWNGVRDLDLIDLYETDPNILAGEGTLRIDPIPVNRVPQDYERREKFFLRALENPFGECAKTIILNGKFPYEVVADCIEQLEIRNIQCIERLWPVPEYNESLAESREWRSEFGPLADEIYTGYTKETFYNEIPRLFDFVQKAYRAIAKQMLSKDSPELVDRTKYCYYFDPQTRDSYVWLSVSAADQFTLKCEFIDISGEELEAFRAKLGFSTTVIDFSKLPLYSIVDYFISHSLYVKYNIFGGCVVLGETISKDIVSGQNPIIC